MKTITNPLAFAIVLATAVAMPPAVAASGNGSGLTLGSGFTHQLRFNQRGAAAEGVFDFEFELYDQAAGGELLGYQVLFDQEVSAGVLNAELDFGQRASGGERWLEIHVRQAGAGAFTDLVPRQKVANTVSPCAVDGALITNGDISCKGTRISHLDGAGSELTGIGYSSGRLSLRNAGSDRAFVDANGNFGIGIVPNLPLRVAGGSDLNLSDTSGQALVGSFQSTNIVLDANEIQARNDGAAATLYLNHEGGDVHMDGGGSVNVSGDASVNVALSVAGALDPKFEMVQATCAGSNVCTAACPAGKKVLGGGCASSGNNQLIDSMSVADNLWHCDFRVADPVDVTVWLACAAVY